MNFNEESRIQKEEKSDLRRGERKERDGGDEDYFLGARMKVNE